MPVKVLIIESELGWGQRIDQTMEFPTRKKAEKFCREYNDKYNPRQELVPNWYMFAKIEGDND
jgi:hypothetical protein